MVFTFYFSSFNSSTDPSFKNELKHLHSTLVPLIQKERIQKRIRWLDLHSTLVPLILFRRMIEYFCYALIYILL